MIDNSYAGADFGGSYDFGGFDSPTAGGFDAPVSSGFDSSPAPLADSFGPSSASSFAAPIDDSFVGPPAPPSFATPSYSADEMAGDFAREGNRFTSLPSAIDTPAASPYTGGEAWAADVAARRSAFDWWSAPAAAAPAAIDTTPHTTLHTTLHTTTHTTTHTTPRSIEVQPGDSLSRIAGRLAGDGASAGTVNDLKNGFIAANPQLSNPNLLQVGDWLNLPRAGTAIDAAAMARATAADLQFLAARQPVPAWDRAGFSPSFGSGSGFGTGLGFNAGFGGPSFLDGLGAGFNTTPAAAAATRAPLPFWDRAGAHALGVYDAAAGALDGAAHSFGLVGTPESRAAWAIETTRAAVNGLRSFFSDPGGATSRWWNNLTGDDPAAIRQATALPAGVGLGLATGYAGSARGLGGGLRGLSQAGDAGPAPGFTSLLDDPARQTADFAGTVSRPLYTERSIFSSFPERTTLQLDSLDAQANFLSTHIPGLTPTQASSILDSAFTRDSSAVFGGSRVRGNFTDLSDIDVGFGSLTQRQAQRVIGAINGEGHAVPMERLPIVPGKSTPTIPEIVTPEEFFQRSGIRAGGDPRAGEPFFPSGSVTVTGDGRVLLIPPGQ